MAKRKLRPILSTLWEVFVWLMPVLIVSSASLLLYFLISAQSHLIGCKERDLRIFGLFIQIVGFALTAWSLSKASAQDGRNAVINWFFSFPRLYVRVFNISLEAGAYASDFMDSRATVSISDDAPLDDQVKAIKAKLANMFNELGSLTSRLRALESGFKSDFQTLHAKIDSSTNKIGQELVEVRSGQDSFELLGVVIFVVGSILSTASPEMASWAVGHGAALCP